VSPTDRPLAVGRHSQRARPGRRLFTPSGPWYVCRGQGFYRNPSLQARVKGSGRRAPRGLGRHQGRGAWSRQLLLECIISSKAKSQRLLRRAEVWDHAPPPCDATRTWPRGYRDPRNARVRPKPQPGPTPTPTPSSQACKGHPSRFDRRSRPLRAVPDLALPQCSPPPPKPAEAPVVTRPGPSILCQCI
jgi:hypothetical protein